MTSGLSVALGILAFVAVFWSILWALQSHKFKKSVFKGAISGFFLTLLICTVEMFILGMFADSLPSDRGPAAIVSVIIILLLFGIPAIFYAYRGMRLRKQAALETPHEIDDIGKENP